jgi:hydroxyacylglutathione hydrolase
VKIQSFTFNPFLTNCYVVTSQGETVIIDPSCHSDSERDEVINYVASTDSRVVRILLTHAHIDHIFGCADLSEHFGVGIEVHNDERVLLEQAEFQSQMFGIDIKQPPAPIRNISPGENVAFGDVQWNVLHTPGHSPGSVSFVDLKHGFVISGDVLFHDSIGRTDLWQGSLPILMESIFQQLIPLGDEIRVLSGHGPETTIGRERDNNPFLIDFQPLDGQD